MNAQEIHSYLISKHRNIYQEAQLFNQNRRPITEYVNFLAHPLSPDIELNLKDNTLVASNKDEFSINNNVIDFRKVNSSLQNSSTQKQWEELNSFLINYQQYLTPYVLLNSLPIYSYIAEKTGLNKLKNAKVVDVGAGTGQIFGTFFYHQESLEYFLLDPNLRLLHDHFLRLYPKLASYPIGHILCYAENLPFKAEFADLVMSFSSIDHFKDYKQFMSEAHRILKPGGHILIASHLDIQTVKDKVITTPTELLESKNTKTFKEKVLNRLALKSEYYARKYHNKKRGAVKDDHMHHFEDTAILEKALAEAGFQVEQAEVFNMNFYIKAKKI